jgi:hypothetical protein
MLDIRRMEDFTQNFTWRYIKANLYKFIPLSDNNEGQIMFVESIMENLKRDWTKTKAQEVMKMFIYVIDNKHDWIYHIKYKKILLDSIRDLYFKNGIV